jgi:hypothetical protein
VATLSVSLACVIEPLVNQGDKNFLTVKGPYDDRFAMTLVILILPFPEPEAHWIRILFFSCGTDIHEQNRNVKPEGER